MSRHTEVELKFLVPPEAREAIAAQMARRSASVERRTLLALYLDTADRRLARAGIAWRLRRDGRRWIQTVKEAGAGGLERFEHEVIRSAAIHDAAAHAGTRTGDRLLRLLRAAEKDGFEVGVRFQAEVRRVSRRVRIKGAVVEVAFDEGRLLADGSKLRLRELELELVSGSLVAMLAMAERWRKRFDLMYDPRSKAERGDNLAQGKAITPVRKARTPAYARDATVVDAFGTVVDECLAHIHRNAVGLIDGDSALRSDHVHQLRVGIRRLRTALRSFEGWVPPAPQELIDGLRGLFTGLGLARDSVVLQDGVAAELSRVGAPPLAVADAQAGADPVAIVRAPATQKLLLAWIAWRAALAEAPPAAGLLPADVEAVGESHPARAGEEGAALSGAEAPADAVVHPAVLEETFQRMAQGRLRRWHRRIVRDYEAFGELGEEELHSLRKRIKRQRYAVEFFAPLMRRREVARYLKPLAVIQDRMGELNDLFVARQRYQALLESDPAAWFAMGWLAARVEEVRRLAEIELKRFAKAGPPRR